HLLGIGLCAVASELRRRGGGQHLVGELEPVGAPVVPALPDEPRPMGAHRHRHTPSLFGTPSSSRASATVAARRPTSSAIWRALAISSPFDFAISPSGR